MCISKLKLFDVVFEIIGGMFIFCSTGEGGLNLFGEEMLIDSQEGSWIGKTFLNDV